MLGDSRSWSDPLISRRHAIASIIYDHWVSDPDSADACLAPHFVDGSYSALEMFVIEGGESLLAEAGVIPRVAVEEAGRLDQQAFAREYMRPNLPVLVTGLTACWRANQEWTQVPPGVLGRKEPCIHHISSAYGSSVVEVESPPDASSVERTSSGGYERPRTRVTLSEFAISSGGYIKDWHFKAEFPNEAERLFPTPTIFRDDWLNSFAKHAGSSSMPRTRYFESMQVAGALPEREAPSCSHSTSVAAARAVSDYHFVYLGGQGTRTHLHADVLGSYSWSANICGLKVWHFLAPELTYLVRDIFGRRLAPDFLVSKEASSQGALFENARGAGDHWRFPLLYRATSVCEEVVQAAGDAVFVPSEWHHTVKNEVDTLSVNANWLNRHSLCFVSRRLRRTLPTIDDDDDPRQRAAGQKESPQVGKAPFDAWDFAYLLEWKIEEAGRLLACGGNPGVDAASDLSEIARIARDMSEDELCHSTCFRAQMKAAALQAETHLL